MDLLDIQDLTNGKEVVAFIDDVLMLAWGKTLQDANRKVQLMMERQGGSLEWSHTHQCKFAINKFGVMSFTRRREVNPEKNLLTKPLPRYPSFLQGIKIPAVSTHKFLGVLLDQELCWKNHVNYALQKGIKWVTQYHSLTKPSKGILAKYM